MSDLVKAALVLAAAAVAIAAMAIYFSPYWACVRAGHGAAMEIRCLQIIHEQR